MNGSLLPPKSIALEKTGNQLVIFWKSGEQSSISGSELRRYCSCAECRARKKIGFNLVNESTLLDSASLIGGHGLNISFSDGHDRGIYPWSLLRAISVGRAMEYISE